MWIQAFMVMALTICFCLNSSPVRAGTPWSDRLAVQAGVKTEVAKDLSQAARPREITSSRTCLDGRPAKNFEGDIIEYWANLECPYCGIQEPAKAQRENPAICIVVRHIPAANLGESMKKALAYEALRSFSVNSANRFWDAVIPKTALTIPMPYEAALHAALDDAAIAPGAFGDALQRASEFVSADILEAQGRVSTTPTYVIQGIRFPACDFTAMELPQAIALAKRARAGESSARQEIIEMITRGKMDEKLL